MGRGRIIARRARMIFALLLSTALILGGCSFGAQNSGAPGEAKGSLEASQEKGVRAKALAPRVAAKVNGRIITTEEFERRVQKTKFVLAAKGFQFQGPDREKALEELRQQVLQELIREQLILQEAQREGLTASEEEARAAVEEIKKKFAAPETYRKTLESRGLTEESMLKYFQWQLTKEALARKIGDEAKFKALIDDLAAKAKVEINTPVIQQVIQKS